MDISEVLKKESLYCFRVQKDVDITTTSRLCAAMHECRNVGQCPLHVERLIKQTQMQWKDDEPK